MQTNDAERVVRVGVVRAAPHGLLEARLGLLHLAPARAAHAALARAEGRVRRDARRLVVRRERLLELVRELVSVAELHLRRGIALRNALAQLVDLVARAVEIPVEAEKTHEQLPRRDVVRVRDQLLL